MSFNRLYEFRCTWCGLERSGCACGSPEFREHSQCGSCGTWESVDDLEPANDPSALDYAVCSRCR